jgi:hypothetical protein
LYDSAECYSADAIMLRVIILSGIQLSVILLSVILLNVMAPLNILARDHYSFFVSATMMTKKVYKFVARINLQLGNCDNYFFPIQIQIRI